MGIFGKVREIPKKVDEDKGASCAFPVTWTTILPSCLHGFTLPKALQVQSYTARKQGEK